MTEVSLGRRLFGHGLLATMLLTITLLLFATVGMPPSTSLFVSLLETLFLMVVLFSMLAGLAYYLGKKWLERQGKYTILILTVFLLFIAVLIFNMIVAFLTGASVMDAVFMASQATASIENWLIYLGGAFIYLIIIQCLTD
jgi:hypothetical protein